MATMEKNHTKEKNYTKRFIFYTYGLFWFMVSILSVIFVLSGQKTWVLEWGSSIPSWTPTIILLLLFKKIFPNNTIKDFYKKVFSQKISIPLILIVTAIQILIITVSAGIVAIHNNVSFTSLWDFSASTLLLGFIFTIIQGATGEESGWRGFLQPAMEKKLGVIKGSLMVGVVWSFWHTPLWFATGLVGTNLLVYIITFIIGNLSISLIIGICYDYCKNLFIPIWIHFLFNFLARPYIGDAIYIRYWLVSFYVITAFGFALWYKRRTLKR